ncbi:protein FAR1-RELATED SEQUENCE 5-like isoform X1 [Lotus japonicus]|uniref:protein FAR1-RELATED SEQUENCE 5-like isoform X1 n=1 Tax=Lotus japonicus TaxID=34305 RepID=UPI002590A56E|nr:protein FAR1-RELATED SEQUENCE 5-like isoform X1 [Lotus japonicus]
MEYFGDSVCYDASVGDEVLQELSFFDENEAEAEAEIEIEYVDKASNADDAVDELNFFSDELSSSEQTGAPRGNENTMDTVEVNCVADICAIDMKTFIPVQVGRYDFQSLEVAYMFYAHFARAKGFCVRRYNVIRSRKTSEILQQEFVCNKNGKREDRGLSSEQRKRTPRRDTRCGCKAMFRVHVDITTTRWYCTWFTNDHNHDLFDDVDCGLQAPHRKLSLSDIVQLNGMKDIGMGVPHMWRAFATQCGGFENVPFTKRSVYNQIGKKRQMQNSDASSSIQFIGKLSSNDSEMYWERTIDNDRRLQHLFWCDGISRLSYKVYGDVLAFDATYSKNKYLLPVVIFSGVNNHNRTTIFATAVVANETEETYVWLLEHFLRAMDGKHPKAVITDGAVVMKNAIQRVFPNAHHRLCAWHLLCNANTNIGNPLFTQAFRWCMFGDYDIGKFQKKWDEMVAKFGLQNNKWVKGLYDTRKKWASAHLRGKFFAGFRTTSRCEGLHSELGKFVHSRQNLTDFLVQYHHCLKHMRFREVSDDFHSIDGNPVPQTKMEALEMSGGKHFTNAIYLLYVSVIKQATMLKVLQCHEALTCTIYTVAKLISGVKEWHVSVYVEPSDYKCSCMKMESRGLPCEHILAVLHHLKVEELPGCLIMKRWTKGAKDGVYSAKGVAGHIWDSQKSARCGALMDLYRVLSELNSDTLEDFNNARNIANQQIELGRAKRSCQIGDVSNNKNDFAMVRDPVRIRSKARGGKGASSSGVRAKRVLNCSLCKQPGHNKLTCTFLTTGGESLVHMGSSESEYDLFSAEDLNVDD